MFGLFKKNPQDDAKKKAHKDYHTRRLEVECKEISDILSRSNVLGQASSFDIRRMDNLLETIQEHMEYLKFNNFSLDFWLDGWYITINQGKAELKECSGEKE